MPEKVCSNCCKTAKFICMRCNIEPYCSKKCQVAAFPQHRRECFSLPSLKFISSDENMPNLTECDDSKEHSTEELREIKDQVKDHNSKESNGNTEKPAENTVEIPIVADPPKTKDLITPAFKQGVRTAPPNSYKNSPSNISIPKQVEKEKLPEEAPKQVPEKKMYGMEQIRRGQQGPIMKKQSETRFFIKDINVRALAKGKHRVRIANGNEAAKIFYVTEAISEVDEFISYIESHINEYVKTDKTTSYKPLKNELVLAKFDDIYYRAVVEDIIMDDPNKPIYDVFFVDYGNTSQVTEADMKPFKQKLGSELVLNTVFLKNFPDKITDKLGAILSDENGVEINITDESDDCYIAEIVGI